MDRATAEFAWLVLYGNLIAMNHHPGSAKVGTELKPERLAELADVYFALYLARWDRKES